MEMISKKQFNTVSSWKKFCRKHHILVHNCGQVKRWNRELLPQFLVGWSEADRYALQYYLNWGLVKVGPKLRKWANS